MSYVEELMANLEQRLANGSIDDKTYDQEMDILIRYANGEED